MFIFMKVSYHKVRLKWDIAHFHHVAPSSPGRERYIFDLECGL